MKNWASDLLDADGVSTFLVVFASELPCAGRSPGTDESDRLLGGMNAPRPWRCGEVVLLDFGDLLFGSPASANDIDPTEYEIRGSAERSVLAGVE